MPIAGMQLGRFTVRRKLAEGGMAKVYLASEGGEATDTVLKVVHDRLRHDFNFIDMFIAEARVAFQLRHVNLVRAREFGRQGGVHFLAMEYVRGTSLFELRKQLASNRRTFPPFMAAHICAEVARGLEFAHAANGIVHRDVTPDNVLLSFDGEVKVTDFGIAKLEDSQTVPGILKGKYAYMSPEQLRGDLVDARTDIFSLGIILWELLVGDSLFGAASDAAALRAIQQHDFPSPEEVRGGVPPELAAIAMRALAHAPSARYQRADEMASDLANYLGDKSHAHLTSALAEFLTESGLAAQAKLEEAPPRVEGRTRATPSVVMAVRRPALVGLVSLLTCALIASTFFSRPLLAWKPTDVVVRGSARPFDERETPTAIAPVFTPTASGPVPIPPLPPSLAPAVGAPSASAASIAISTKSRLRRTGVLVVRAKPYAVVHANGRHLGEVMGEGTFQLAADTYDISLVRQEKQWTTKVRLVAGETTTIDFPSSAREPD